MIIFATISVNGKKRIEILALTGSLCMVMYDIFPVLKHRKFWIDTDFATIGKIFVYFPLYTGLSK